MTLFMEKPAKVESMSNVKPLDKKIDGGAHAAGDTQTPTLGVHGRTDFTRSRICCSVRLLTIILCFIAVFNFTYTKVGVSMALVCMTRAYQTSEGNQSNAEFEWSSTYKGLLMSAAFYGFVTGPFIAGILCYRFGAKIVMLMATFVSGGFAFFIPEGTRLTPILFFVLRVVIGFFSSFTFPAFYDLVSHWVVPEDRQLMVTAALTGVPFASIINFPITTFVCQSFGWVWIFYWNAIWTLLCGVIFTALLYSTPDHCPFITNKELRYIKSLVPQEKKTAIPWKSIVGSIPIYAYILIHFSLNYIHLSMILSLPLMMSEAYQFALEDNGTLSCIPFVASLVTRMLLSFTFEPFRKKLGLSKDCIRKSAVLTGAVGFSCTTALAASMDVAYRYWIMACFVLGVLSLELCATGGYILSILDMCPRYANVISGIANAFASCAGLVTPVVNGLLTSTGNRAEWNIVLYMNLGVVWIAVVFYIVFGQNEVLDWAKY